MKITYEIYIRTDGYEESQLDRIKKIEIKKFTVN